MKSKLLFNKTTNSQEIASCQALIRYVFNEEYGFQGMKIPDAYSDTSTYVSICQNILIGAYRIVKPNKFGKLPIQNEYSVLDDEYCRDKCEFSRLAIISEYRGQNHFSLYLEDMISHAREFGAKGVLVSALESKSHLFEKNGFLPLSEPIHDDTLSADVKIIPMILEL